MGVPKPLATATIRFVLLRISSDLSMPRHHPVRSPINQGDNSAPDLQSATSPLRLRIAIWKRVYKVLEIIK